MEQLKWRRWSKRNGGWAGSDLTVMEALLEFFVIPLLVAWGFGTWAFG